MYVPNIRVGRIVADTDVKKHMAIESNTERDGNHWVQLKTFLEGVKREILNLIH